MKTLLLLSLTAFLAASGLLACTAVTTDTIPPVAASGLGPAKRTMEAFKSEDELVRYLRQLADKQRRAERAKSSMLDSPAAAPVPAATVAKGADNKAESVTNTQHAGVDEGGIVKVHGDHLVVLRLGWQRDRPGVELPATCQT
jgi:uncharacterized secreted protein with C-terminal beta-propeller domain